MSMQIKEDINKIIYRWKFEIDEAPRLTKKRTKEMLEDLKRDIFEILDIRSW